MRIVFLLALFWIQTFRASETTAATTTAATTTTPAPTTKKKIGKFNSGTGQNKRGKVNKEKCKYEGWKYKAGSIIKLTTGADGCTRAILKCKKVRGKGKIRLEVENNCQCPICPTTTETTLKTPTANTSTTTRTTTCTTCTTCTTSTKSTTSTTNMFVVRLPGTPTLGWRVGPGKVDAIEFSASKDIHIHGISMFGSLTGSSTETGVMEMKEGERYHTAQNFRYTSDGGQGYYDQMFVQQGLARAGVKFTITVEYSTTASIWSRDNGGLTSTYVICNGSFITFTFFASSDSTNGLGVTQGQIPRIIFTC